MTSEEKQMYNQLWYLANAEAVCIRTRQYYWDNAEKCCENHRGWRKKNPERAQFLDERWRKANPEKIKRMYRRRALKKYGLDEVSYDDMLARQNYVCAICKSNNGGRTFHVDHDHKTDIVRALLCSRCNPGLGAFKDDPELLEAAAAYLRNNTCRHV